MKKENLPYKVFDLAASMFAGENSGFSHNQMIDFFCHELNQHPSELEIPGNINRMDKFKWFLRLFPINEQCRVLELLCRNEYKHSPQYSWPSSEARERLLQMLGGSPVQIPASGEGVLDMAFIREAWAKSLRPHR